MFEGAVYGGMPPFSKTQGERERETDEIALLRQWLRLAAERARGLGDWRRIEPGQEPETCGNLEMDGVVGRLLLQTAQRKLPDYGVVDAEGRVHHGRVHAPLQARVVQLLPQHLFTINWADTAPGVAWPESYYVTYVPQLEARIVTASWDDDSLWGSADLAIGACRPVREPTFGTKKIIQAWWRRQGEDQSPWESFWDAGLVSKQQALAWRVEAYGAKDSGWDLGRLKKKVRRIQRSHGRP